MAKRPEWLRRQLREFIRDKEGSLIRYTMRITGDIDRARDVVQEALLRMCDREDDALQADLKASKLAAWLYTVCRNRAIDLCRKEQRMHALDNAQLEAYPSTEASASSKLEHQQQKRQLQEIIQSLPTNLQEVVHLKFHEGMSYKQISEVTSLSVSHVGVLLHKAVKMIRQEVAGREHMTPKQAASERRSQ